ncbi:lysine 5,6-aminomutase reactivase ATPase KamC [Clostridium felsineum]|uniref:Endonuclease MutS2 n=1 Tax=Clostridium felsineum TaxID=36839 RepID=A0A1S8L617_9CLOT|nr:hypothetical protein [Clostridium felsineum]URZ08722.1 Endonuclease MutS2 [Clostridium felsineum]URZ09350.1 Endonuclease MutS2 [Clostridium felsineum]
MIFSDETTRKKIGFDFVLDKLFIGSVFGKYQFSKLHMLTNNYELLREYENIESCSLIIKDSKCFNELQSLLMRFKDIRNTFKRLKNEEVLDQIELFEIKNYTILISELKQSLKNNNLKLNSISFNDFNEIYTLLNKGNTRTLSFAIYDDYSPKLSSLRKAKRNVEKLIYKEKDSEKRKKLLKNRADITYAEKEEEFIIRKTLSLEISKYADMLLENSFNVGKLDITIAKTKYAIDYGLSKPILTDKIKIKKGFNPMVKEKVEQAGGIFQPIDIDLSFGTTVITGANMGGKTVVLSIVALNYILAYMGFYVFAEKFEFVPLDFMYFLSEDAESIRNGLSTFGGEVMKLKQILKDIKKKHGLIILDEFARGTNPEEGSKITKGLVKYLGNFASISLISTHYNGVSNISNNHYQVKGLSNFDFNSINKIEKDTDFFNLINKYMDYSLEKVTGSAPIPKDAMNILRLMGIDTEIIEMGEKDEE